MADSRARSAAPEIIPLPSEPYDFGPRDALELAALALPAARNGRIHRIDGTLVSWYGPWVEPAIATLLGRCAPIEGHRSRTGRAARLRPAPTRGAFYTHSEEANCEMVVKSRIDVQAQERTAEEKYSEVGGDGSELPPH